MQKPVYIPTSRILQVVLPRQLRLDSIKVLGETKQSNGELIFTSLDRFRGHCTSISNHPLLMIKFWVHKFIEFISNFQLSFLSGKTITIWRRNSFLLAVAHACAQCDRRRFQKLIISLILNVFLKIFVLFQISTHLKII